MPVSLDSLTPYFDHVSVEEEEKIDELYALFEADFYAEPIVINGLTIKCKRHVYNPSKDGLPGFYSRYYEKFVHLITREEPPVKRGKFRQFDGNRANRVHWIRPILEAFPDPRISHFRNLEANGSIRDYFWFKPMGFIVILEKVIPDYVLITAFSVDNENLTYFERKERNALK